MNIHEEFIQSFNNIEKILKEEVDNQDYLPFYRLVDLNSKKNKIVKKHKQELKVLADLRNIIVHGDIKNPVAVPSKNSLEKIKFIEKQLFNPPKIMEVFDNNIKGVRITEPLTNVLNIIREYGYSQFPVVKDNKFIGLITENGITNWLAKNIEEDIISIKETSIEDVIVNDEESKSYDLLYSQDTLYDVIEKFEDNGKRISRTYSIIVLNKPRREVRLEDIYTIITPWDLEIIYKNIDS